VEASLRFRARVVALGVLSTGGPLRGLVIAMKRRMDTVLTGDGSEMESQDGGQQSYIGGCRRLEESGQAILLSEAAWRCVVVSWG
jgi:hypothetical protein